MRPHNLNREAALASAESARKFSALFGGFACVATAQSGIDPYSYRLSCRPRLCPKKPLGNTVSVHTSYHVGVAARDSQAFSRPKKLSQLRVGRTGLKL